MHAPRRVTPPSDTLIDLDQIKAHCRVDHDDDNAFLEELLASAVAYVDGPHGRLRRCVLSQQWEQPFDCLSYRMTLPLGPVQNIEAITYIDGDGNEVQLDPSIFRLINEHGYDLLVLKESEFLPQQKNFSGSVVVKYTAGAGDNDNMLQAVKQAVRMLVGHWYEHREAVTMAAHSRDVPKGVDMLLSQYRILKIS